MRRYYSFIIFLLCQTWVLNGWGQQKLVLEQIQVYSSINPSASYWKLPSDITPIIKAIDSGILLKMGLPRDTNIVTKEFYLTKQSQLGKIKRASQGQFSISNRDKNNPHIKRVRVVSTIEYYLAD